MGTPLLLPLPLRPLLVMAPCCKEGKKKPTDEISEQQKWLEPKWRQIGICAIGLQDHWTDPMQWPQSNQALRTPFGSILLSLLPSLAALFLWFLSPHLWGALAISKTKVSFDTLGTNLPRSPVRIHLRSPPTYLSQARVGQER